MKIKNVVFDFNGTLLNDVEVCFDIEKEMQIREHVSPLLTEEEYFNLFGFPVRDYYKTIGFDDNKYPELAKLFMKLYHQRWFKESSVYENCEKVLGDLKEKGYNLYVLSATEDTFLTKQLQDIKLLQYFDGTIGSSNIDAKEKISYGKKYLDEHNVNSEETILIGDTIHDYETSKHLGLRCLLFSKGHCSLERLKKTMMPIANSYLEIEDYILNN
ncbi:MAG: HAD-IA family hydrolase [Bacilli bacterium]